MFFFFVCLFLCQTSKLFWCELTMGNNMTFSLCSVPKSLPGLFIKNKIPSQRNVCVFYPPGALEFCNTCLCSDWLGSNMPVFGSCSLQHSISLSFSSLIAPPSSPYQIITSWQGRGNGSSFTSCIRMRCNLSAISGVIQQPPGRSSVLLGHCSLELIMERLVPH